MVLILGYRSEIGVLVTGIDNVDICHGTSNDWVKYGMVIIYIEERVSKVHGGDPPHEAPQCQVAKSPSHAKPNMDGS